MKTNPFAMPANLMRRTGAAILDLFLWFVTSLLLLSYVFGPLYDAQYGTTQLSNQFVAFQQASYLYNQDETTNQLVNLDVADVPEALLNYYAEFKDGKVYETGSAAFTFSIQWYNETILKVNEPTSFFQLVNDDLTVLAVVKDGIDQTDLDGFYTDAYRQALIDFNTYPPFSSLVALINGYFIEIIIYSVSISFVIFYLIVPLALKRGQTLGKRLSGLIVVNDKGYAMQWWQLPLRSVVLGVTLFTALYTVFGSLLLSYTLMVFTKGYRSANDFLGLTKIVDGKTSKIFKSESEMLAYEHTLTNQESNQLLGK
jgi:uncharacterized RDD family membrane protein YckC